MEYTLKNKKLHRRSSNPREQHFIPSKTMMEWNTSGKEIQSTGPDRHQFYFQFVEASEMIKHRLEIENRQTCQDMVS